MATITPLNAWDRVVASILRNKTPEELLSLANMFERERVASAGTDLEEGWVALLRAVLYECEHRVARL